MNWLSQYLGREKEIARLQEENAKHRREIERLHDELKCTDQVIRIVNGNLRTIAEMAIESANGDEDGFVHEYVLVPDEPMA
jgi:cell division protein FtsB